MSENKDCKNNDVERNEPLYPGGRIIKHSINNSVSKPSDECVKAVKRKTNSRPKSGEEE